MKESILNQLTNITKVGESNPYHPNIVVGTKAKFKGSSDEQVKWGGNDDPRPHLLEGSEYEVSYVEIHTWHTKISLIGFDGLKFNSASFEIK